MNTDKELKLNKGRENVGIQGMKEYEFGGLVIDEKLRDGYNLFIPYGLHVDLFDAIWDSVLLIQEKKIHLQEMIDELVGEDKAMKMLRESFLSQIDKLTIQEEMLLVISPLINEV